MAAQLPAVRLPATGLPSEQFCEELQQALHKATWAGVHATSQVLPAELLQTVVQAVIPILNKEPTLIEVQPAAVQQRVTVVGDTHGQYHDVCRLFETFGPPSAHRIYIFNGDYVDRGAWGVEVLLLLLAYKWLLPGNVYLLRGNHETNIITRVYGFYAELKAKYGPEAKGLFVQIRRVFAALPLAAVVEGSTLILHGGLFRAPPQKTKTGAKRRRSSGVKLAVGTLEDLRKASKGGQDPDPDRSLKNLIASDVMWSDPVNATGLRPNEARGCGTVFGPDVTAAFLEANGLKLIIRSHEGPDARDKRQEGDRMPPVDSGYAVDHDTPNGKLVTLFSAPDYPQFMAEGEERYHNQGAVVHLTGPDYATPEVESFEAVLPRPQVESYYDVPGYSDDEDELADKQEDSEQEADDKASTATPSAAAGCSRRPGAAAAAGVKAAADDTAEAAATPCAEAPAVSTEAPIHTHELGSAAAAMAGTEPLSEPAGPTGVASIGAAAAGCAAEQEASSSRPANGQHTVGVSVAGEVAAGVAAVPLAAGKATLIRDQLVSVPPATVQPCSTCTLLPSSDKQQHSQQQAEQDWSATGAETVTQPAAAATDQQDVSPGRPVKRQRVQPPTPHDDHALASEK